MTVPKSTCCNNKANFKAPVINFNTDKSPEKILEKTQKVVLQRRLSVKSDNASSSATNKKLDHESRRIAKSHEISIVSNNSRTKKEIFCPVIGKQVVVNSSMMSFTNSKALRARSAPKCGYQQRMNYYMPNNLYQNSCQNNYFVYAN